jgi:uncharacterized protein YcbK (DUF882 family)
VQVSFARQLITAARSSGAGRCAVLAAVMLAFGSRGLETAIANGDTRTLTMHHIHTGEDITITYKRDGRYDEDALAKLDWFVRDWRRDEAIHMDPRLYDLVWEATRQAGSKEPAQIVCGYRSPNTNSMLRSRSSGVARFSQHTLGKAMDFFIPGAPLEELRIIGVRLQRGGVGYYPTSGAPFVHLDVGPVRYWPHVPEAQMAKALPQGRTIFPPAESRSFEQALADVKKRQPPVQVASADGSVVHKKSLLHSLFGKDEEDEAAEADEAAAAHVAAAAPAPVAPASTAAAPRRNTNTYSLASVDSKPETVKIATAPVVPIPPVRGPRVQLAQAGDNVLVGGTPSRDDWTFAGASEPPRPPAPIKPANTPEITGGAATPWPMRTGADTDHVPADVALSYATQSNPGERNLGPAIRPEPMGEASARGAANAPAKITSPPRDNVTTITKKTTVTTASPEPVQRATSVAVVANAGMRYDDPWLRAMLLTPSLSNSMTSIIYGEMDLEQLRAMMKKPTTTITMLFGDDPYPGISPDRFNGEAVVFLATHAFNRRTAALR